MIASLYQSESDIVWDFRRDAVSDAMGSCTCHLARPGDAPRIVQLFRQRVVAHHGGPDRRVVWPGNAPGCKIGRPKIDLRAFHDELRENEALPMTVLETHYHRRNC